MLGYYLDLAVRSLKRNRILTTLMVAAIGLGIGASMTMLTVLHVMTADPIPGRSTHLFLPQVDARDKDNRGDDPPEQLTWRDAMGLRRPPPSWTAGSSPATSASWTRTATSSSSTAART